MAFPADNTSGSAVWNIGTVVTTSENDSATSAISPAIRISYYARVNNDLVTDAGDTLQNTIAVDYTHGETGAPQTITAAAPIVTVVEPRLTLAKTLSNVTSPGNPPVAGDIIEYRVTATNAGTATAFDVNVVDTLPAGVVLNSGFTPTATINGVPVAGFVATPAGAPAGPPKSRSTRRRMRRPRSGSSTRWTTRRRSGRRPRCGRGSATPGTSSARPRWRCGWTPKRAR